MRGKLNFKGLYVWWWSGGSYYHFFQKRKNRYRNIPQSHTAAFLNVAVYLVLQVYFAFALLVCEFT